MTMSAELHGGIVVLKLKGTFIGKASVSIFEQAIFERLKNNMTSIVLDLADLKFIDSAGLGAMISAMVSIGRTEGALKLAAPGGDVAKVMKSMHLDKVFTIYASVSQAEASF